MECVGYYIEFKLRQGRKKDSGHGHRIHRSKIRHNILVSTILFDKSHVERRIMRYQDRIPNEFQKLREHRLDIRRIHDHLIRNAGQLGDAKRDWDLGIYECAEPLCYLPVLYLHRAYLYNLILNRAKARRLQIEYYIDIVQRLPLFAHGHIRKVIDQIAFYSVDHLKRIVFIQGLYVMVGVRECLDYSVVSDGNRLVSPVMGAFYKILYFRYSIHIAHLRMAMKLYPLFRSRILPGLRKIINLSNSCDRPNGKLAIKFINGGDSLDLKECALLYVCQNIRKLLVSHKHLDHDRICKVCHRIHDDRLLVTDLPGIKTDDLAADGDLAHLANYLF